MVCLISPHIIGPQHQRLWTCSQTRFLRDEGSQTFSVKRQLVNILASAGHMVSITTVNSATGVKKQPQRYRNEWLWLHSKGTLFTKSGGGLDLACASCPAASLVAQRLRIHLPMQERRVWSGREDPLEKEMATHSSVPVWKSPMDRGACWATVHGVAELGTTKQLSTCLVCWPWLFTIGYWFPCSLDYLQ